MLSAPLFQLPTLRLERWTTPVCYPEPFAGSLLLIWDDCVPTRRYRSQERSEEVGAVGR